MPDHRLGFREKEVLLESVLDGDRFRGPVRDDCTVVDPACEFVQAKTIPAEVLFEQGQFQFSQISHRLYSELRQLVPCNFADSRQASDRKRQEKRIDILGLNDKEPIRFAPTRSEFCQKFVRRYARGGCLTQFLADLVTNCAGH